MAINDIVQTMADARVDARSLSEFVFKPAGFKVARRLAPPIDTLQFYIDRFNATKAATDAYVATIPTIVNNAINNTAVEGGVLADTFVTVTAKFGGVARTQADVNAQTVSIEDFYTTSWSDALKLALESPASNILIPDNKSFVLETPVTAYANNKTLSGKGEITSLNSTLTLISIIGDGNKCVGLNIDGKGVLSNAISMTGLHVEVLGCTIKNLYSTETNSAIAVYITSDGYFKVADNTFSNISAISDGDENTGKGMARAISVARKNPASARGYVTNNTINDMRGNASSGITVHSTSLENADVIIEGNKFNGWDRRAIKVQAFGVDIIKNTLVNKQIAGHTYYFSGSLNMIEAGDCKVEGNVFDDFGTASVLLNLTSTDPARQAKYQNVDISNNTFNRPDADDSLMVYLGATKLKNYTVKENTFVGGSVAPIAVALGDGGKFIKNDFYLSDADSETVISIINSGTGTFIATGNTLHTGLRSSMMRIYDATATDLVIVGNISANKTAIYWLNNTEALTSIVSGNITKGTLERGSGSLIRRYDSGNLSTDGTSEALQPTILSSSTIPSNELRYGSLPVKKGMLVMNTTGSNPHFWRAQDDGIASEIVWDNMYMLTQELFVKLNGL